MNRGTSCPRSHWATTAGKSAASRPCACGRHGLERSILLYRSFSPDKTYDWQALVLICIGAGSDRPVYCTYSSLSTRMTRQFEDYDGWSPASKAVPQDMSCCRYNRLYTVTAQTKEADFGGTKGTLQQVLGSFRPPAPVI